MLANTQDDGRQPAYAAIDKRLTLHATQDGRPLAIALTSGMPWGLQPSPGATGHQFAAAANQIITLSILMNDGAVATRPWS